MAQAEERNNISAWQQRISADLTLGALVAILSVLTALAAYRASILDAQASGHEVEGQRTLSESNAEYLTANQEIILDYTLYDNFVVNQDEDEFAAQYYQENFSQALLNSLERTTGPFDDQYYDELLGNAEALYDLSLDEFNLGQELGDRANQIQLVMLIFAVGLSLAAWASLLDEGSRLRASFAIFSTIAMATALLYFAFL